MGLTALHSVQTAVSETSALSLPQLPAVVLSVLTKSVREVCSRLGEEGPIQRKFAEHAVLSSYSPRLHIDPVTSSDSTITLHGLWTAMGLAWGKLFLCLHVP